MGTKTTEELNHEIKRISDVEDFLVRNKEHLLICGLPEYLDRMLEQKGVSKADVVRGSMLDRTYVYQIFSGKKMPSRDKLIAIAFGLCLSEEEVQKMLKLSGNRELYIRDERDVLILFSFQKGNNIFETNERLIRHGHAVLGAPSR